LKIRTQFEILWDENAKDPPGCKMVVTLHLCKKNTISRGKHQRLWDEIKDLLGDG